MLTVVVLAITGGLAGGFLAARWWFHRPTAKPDPAPLKMQAPKARVLTEAEVQAERVAMRERLAGQYGAKFTGLGAHEQSALVERLTKEARQLLGGGR